MAESEDGVSNESAQALDEAAATPTGKHRRHRMVRGLLYAVAFLLAAVVGFVAFAVFQLQGNISSIDISGALGNRPAIEATRDSATDRLPLNILLVGSDTRSELKDPGQFGGTNELTSKDHSDTTILLHVAADRKSAYGISIPRDSMVHRPDCKNPNSLPLDRTEIGQFNAAYDAGGIGCTVMTVEANTGVRIDHYAIVNFEGFSTMVDALGGVDICLPKAVKDKFTGLDLPAGTSHLSGHQASQFVRARHGIGDGSDIGRMQRQQQFLSALIREATDSKLLLRPDRLYSFLDAATNSVTTDPDLAGISRLTDLASQIRGLKPSEIQFITVPNEPYPKDVNRVQWLQPLADQIWEAARTDSPLPVEGAPAGATVPTVSPADITVQVTNASGVPGLARQSADVLSAQGFVVTGYDTAPSTTQGVEIRYPVGQQKGANTLLAAFPGAKLTQDNAATSAFEVIMGAGAPAVAEVPNRVGKGVLPEQPIGARPTATEAPAEATPTPTLTPRVASDAACG